MATWRQSGVGRAGTRRRVYAAFTVNALIVVFKFVFAPISGSTT
ncbi:hypothetical protein BH20ACT12_BH20ACT12_11670 [soil metagenome]